jgi:hypothetical protein
MKPPLYSPVPTTLTWERPDIPGFLKLTYIELYALTWTGKRYRPYLKETVEELTEIISQAEGIELSVKGMEKRLYQLSNYGLTERRRVGQEWRTYLLLRADRIQTATDSQQPASHRQPQPDSYRQGESTPTPGRSQPAPAPTARGTHFKENVVDVVGLISELDQQQQHLFNYLRLREVLPETALDFVQRGISLWDAVQWGEYAWRRRKRLDNYAGLIVKELGAGHTPPDIELKCCPICGKEGVWYPQKCTCGFMDALDEDDS